MSIKNRRPRKAPQVIDGTVPPPAAPPPAPPPAKPKEDRAEFQYDPSMATPPPPPDPVFETKKAAKGNVRRQRNDVAVQDFTVSAPKKVEPKKEFLVEFVHSPNRIRKKVGDGTAFDKGLIHKAQEAVKHLAGHFLEATHFDLRELNDAYRSAKIAQETNKDPSPYMSRIYKVIHDIKGGGGSFGFPLVSRIAESLCWFTEGLTHPAEPDLQIMKAHIDSLTVVVHLKLKGHGGEVGQLMAEGLELCVAKRKAHDPTAVQFDLGKFMEKLRATGTT